jgi:hypothetical protein
MSIYCSIFDFGYEHKPRCARMKKLRPKVYEVDDSKPCTCGSSPVKYQGSHVLPSKRDARDGSLGIAAIPGHIHRYRRKPLSDDNMPYHPWLRVSINVEDPTDQTVLLTRVQVQALKDELEYWLKNTTEGK